MPRVVQGAGGEEGLVVVDGVFSAAVLAQLKAFCDESTVFFDVKAGYLGAYLGDGFSSGLLLQAAALLRRRLPRTVGRELLTQVWAYKYDSEVEQGIRMHVDQGRYSVNCWLTPNDALLPAAHGGSGQQQGGSAADDAGAGGGLRLFRGAGVEHRDSVVARRLRNDTFGRSNQDFRFLKRAVQEAHEEELRRRRRRRPSLPPSQGADDGPADDAGRPIFRRPGVTVVDVPYRQNRCVIFRSDLLHETGALHFKTGYTKRRINLTFMFGNGAHRY